MRGSRSAIWFGAECPLCPLNCSIFYFLLTCFQQQLCDCLVSLFFFFFKLAMHIQTSRITFRMWSKEAIADLQLPRSPKTCDLPAKRSILRWFAGNKSSCNWLSWNKGRANELVVSERLVLVGAWQATRRQAAVSPLHRKRRPTRRRLDLTVGKHADAHIHVQRQTPHMLQTSRQDNNTKEMPTWVTA